MKLIVVDLECTCWKEPTHKTGEITEIGICLVDFTKNQIERQNGYYVRPVVLDISNFCTELTGITKELLIEKGRYLDEVINTIKKEYPLKSVPWASWGDFDRICFQNECINKGIEYPFSKTHFNLKILHAIKEKLPKGVGMEKALEKYQMPLIGRHHSGKDDAYNTALLALKIIG
jgi:inhibitor of KinA sporulation pathway (predicted exonuclease)